MYDLEYIYIKPNGAKQWRKVWIDEYLILVDSSEKRQARIVCSDCGKGALVCKYKIKIGKTWCFDCEEKQAIAHKRQANFCRKEVAKAIADGHLIKQKCEHCRSKNTVAHHHDYSRPLDVNWLCGECHANWHKEFKTELLIRHAISLKPESPSSNVSTSGHTKP